MENKNTLTKLSRKVAMVFGASLAALSGTANSSAPITTTNDLDGKTIENTQAKTVKPITVLKLNLNNPETSKLVMGHHSHSSHRSHNSHHSHYSGAMFS